MATPAEEYIEIEYRDALRRQGELEFLGGKNWQHWNHIPRLPL
jgi:hypothetical protein